MRNFSFKVFSLLLIWGSLFSFSEAYYSVGSPQGFVNDYTHTLRAEEIQKLEEKLSEFEKNTSNEIAIVVIDDLKGDTIENFAVKLFQEWGIGKGEKDNGVLILIAKRDKQIRIEVGYGLEGVITDAQASKIIEEILMPAFRQGDFNKGINEAVDHIMLLIRKGEGGNSATSLLPDNKKKISSMIDLVWIILVIVILLKYFLGKSKSWWLGGVAGGIIGALLVKGLLYIKIIGIIFFIIFGLFLDYFFSKLFFNKKRRKRKGSNWWGGGIGRGGGGFGGFGGGMSGGGGASGRW